MIICPSFFDGNMNGIGRVSDSFYQALSAMGHRPQVLSANEPQSASHIAEGYGYNANYKQMIWAGLTQNFRRPPIVVCMHLGLSPVARLISARYNVPYLVFLHGIEAWDKLSPRRHWGLAGAHKLLANSQFTLSHFHRFNPDLASIPILVTPLGIGHMPDRPPMRDAMSLRVLIVGRIVKGERDKGHRTLIQAMEHIVSDIPEAVLTIIGDGEDRADLEAFAKRFSLGNRVEFVGRVPDETLPAWYDTSAVFAMPSESEGFGLVYLEAMARGIPCLCSDVDAAREVVVHGETGLAVSPRSPFLAAESLIQLLRDAHLRASFGEAGRTRYASLFTANHFELRIQNAIAPYIEDIR
ncbi:GDP-mannose-dependent alpha-(1-6)-phosphatidylinositol monomannoside mannosyltransferase [compost metagenome]